MNTPDLQTVADVDAQLAALHPVVFHDHLQVPQHLPELMAYLGNPQEQYKVIHVAGTSGKTSTAYYAAALLRAAGKRVGLTISPHAESLTERVQIDLQPLPEARFCEEFSRFLEIIQPLTLPLNYFQMITAFAFWEFAQAKVDYAVVEVGIGGLADSTNVIARPDKICVITDISYGHARVIGPTLSDIAANKAGIIQAGTTVFCRQQSEEILTPVRARALAKRAELQLVDAISGYAFLPPFQRRNFAMAEAAVRYALVRDSEPALPAQALEQAAQTVIPARLEVHRLANKTIVLDAAHNPQKMQALIDALGAQYPGLPVAVLFATTRGRHTHLEDMLRIIAGAAQTVLLCGFPPEPNGRFGSADPALLQSILHDLKTDAAIFPDVPAAFHALLQRPERLLVITGSFYLLNHIRPLLAADS